MIEEKPIDWELFEKLASYPRKITTNEELAQILKISKDTLENRIRDKYDMTLSAYRDQKYGTFKMHLFNMQLKSAQKGNAALQIFLGKNYLQQEDRQTVSIPQADIVLKYATGKK